ncbi:MAG: trp operon repressor [Treponema sp.]|nr:trp operon repressor [Treponema sp.]
MGKSKTNDPVIQENLSELALALSETRDPALILSFLQRILTPMETRNIASRWALVKALEQKIPQREIARTLGLSLCKITRGSREMKNPDQAFNKMLAAARKKRPRPPPEKT